MGVMHRVPHRRARRLWCAIAAWEKARNDAEARIQWMFTTERARQKLGRVYRPLAKAREDAAREQGTRQEATHETVTPTDAARPEAA